MIGVELRVKTCGGIGTESERESEVLMQFYVS